MILDDEEVATPNSGSTTAMRLNVEAELDEPLFADRHHGTAGTYAKGCRGPLCRKLERDRKRYRRNQANPDTRTRSRREQLHDALLDSLQRDHSANFLKTKEGGN